MKQRLSPRPLAAALLFLFGANALASPADTDQGPAPPDPTHKAKQLQQVVVTGTHSSTRTAQSSLAPVDVLSAEALQNTGATDVGTALSKLEPSLNFPMQAGNDAAGSQRPVSMRGLAPDMVLVLVDGKRYHTPSYVSTAGLGVGTAPVDFQTIPISMIDHIEVLRDGAAALYGSDAIAGVVNIVLKKGAAGGAVDLTTGKYSAGDGNTYLATANFGIPLDNDRGWIRFDLEKGYNGHISRSQPNIYDDTGVGATLQGSTPSVQDKSLNMNGQYDLTPHAQLYFSLINTWRDDYADMNYRYNYLRYADYSSTQVGSPADGYKGYPEWALYPQGYQPTLLDKTLDNEFVLGVRGDADGWKWDLGANYGSNRLSIYTIHSINRAWYQDFGTNPNGGDFYDGTFHNRQYVATADVTKDLGLSWLPNDVTLAFGAQYMRETYSLSPGDPASYYSTTTEGSAPNSGTPQGGAQAFVGYAPNQAGNWERNSVAEYISLETNLTDDLGISLAGRHEHYSDFGNTTTGALSLRYDFTSRFALRGSVSTGFKAPSLAQSYYSSVTSAGYQPPTVPVAGLYNGGVFPVTNPLSVALGAQPLKPEKSTNYSFGMVWSPIDDLNLTLDLYQINVRDRLAYTGSIPTQNQNVPDYAAYIATVVSGQYASVQYMFNGFDTRTRGADLVADYLSRFDNGSELHSTLSFNVNGNKVTGYSAVPPALAAVQARFPGVPLTEQLFSPSLIKGTFEHGSPNTKLVLDNIYDIGPWSFDATVTRYGSVTSYGDPSSCTGVVKTPIYPDGLAVNCNQVYGARWLLDLSASYRYGNWNFTLGGDNVLDTYPEKNSYYKNQTEALPYPTLSPFGFYGAYVYAKVGYHW